MLDEKGLRKPTFSEGTRVRLADGQEWTFPRPRLRIYPRRDPEGKFYAAGGPSYGPDFEDRYDEFMESVATRDDTPECLYRIECLHLELAAILLLANYELDDRDLRRLLVIEYDDPESEARWEAVNDVLACRVKKN